MTLSFGPEGDGQDQAFLPRAEMEGRSWDRSRQGPFAGWRGMLFQDSAGSRPRGAKQDMPACGREPHMPVRVARGGYRATGHTALNDPGLAGWAFWGGRLALEELSLLSKLEASVGLGAVGLAVWGSPHAGCEGQHGLGWVGRDCQGLGSDLADHLGVPVKRRASPLAGRWVWEKPNDLWQSLLVTGTVWLVLRLKSCG